MKSRSIVLLSTLLRSTSQWNIYKHCKDKRKKGRIIGNTVGYAILFLLIMAYCVFTCVGYGKLGLADSIPGTCALLVSALAFFFTLMKTNGYLFGFREYDMLMSLPFSPKTVAGCKFLYMYVKSLGWFLAVSFAMMIGYGIYATPSVIVYPVWIVLTFFLPIIPMLAAAFVGFLIAKVSAGFRKTNIVQTVLIFVFILLMFGSRFLIEDVVRNQKVDQMVSKMSDAMDRATHAYPPAQWFSDGVSVLRVSDILLLVGLSILLFEAMFLLVGRSYRRINSGLLTHGGSKKFTMSERKKRPVVQAIAVKEWKRMTGSATYMTNAIFGELLVLILGVASLFVDLDAVLQKILHDAPVTKEMLIPAIPLIVYFFIGMVATTAITPSIEGKQYWIVQSLPIPKKTLYQGKMLFNMYLTVPCTAFSTICLCISARASILTTVLSVLLGICLCAFSTCAGCASGIKHMRLDWENEIEVVKQSAAVSLYLLPNMFATMILTVLVVVIGMKVDVAFVLLGMMLVEILLAVVFYKKAMKLAQRTV